MRDLPADTGLRSFRRFTWWTLILLTGSLLIFSSGPWILDPGVPAAARPPAAGGLAVTAVAAAVLFGRRLSGDPGGSPGRVPAVWLAAGCAGATVLGGVLLAARGYGAWSFAPATMVSIAATYLPAGRRWALVAAAAGAAGVAGGGVALALGDDPLFAAALPAGLVALTGWVTLGMLWSWDVADRLNQARRLSAELAVKDERLRFAADLHDIQGHHLQVIALKSELAARLAAADPARAAAEMQEVRRLAADALRDTRAVVQGYRRTTLEAEIANATGVLAAAGIDATTHADPVDPADPSDPSGPAGLPETARHLLGLVMREATTNVLRHSRARHAEVGYRVAGGLARLRVANDGARRPAGSGTGLTALAERLAAAGGELTWEHAGDRFTVTATLPVDGRTPRTRDSEA
ncbi:histidine kinase [Nonomuraea sp. B10E15]|uniref:sensor histidine kinase n=1 Tax=Nonomuraea sp. B10E15 TaxID=3153560 RepID=UPI00325F5C48